MTHYVVGFAFRGNDVVLIRKTKPRWQYGKLNGVGGKIEDGETCNVAMAREFEEETGCKTFCTDWVKFTEMKFPEAVVHCFATLLPSHKEVCTTTEEEVVLVDVRGDCQHETIPNLEWLIPMAAWAVSPSRPFEDNSLPHTLDHV